MDVTRLRFPTRGPVALAASAVGLLFEVAEPSEPAPVDGVACVEIFGPLAQHRTFGFDSYEAIGERFARALATDAHTIVLKISSPGGDVHGCFELARAMRAGAAGAGKQLVAYVDGTSASAAYALSCAADEIYVPETAVVGSIGVIETLQTAARAEGAMGVDTVLITSGSRKADGNPHAPISDGAVAACQRHVDALAAIFYRWVADRRGLSSETVAELQAGVFVGQSAVDAKLVDGVVSDYGALHSNPARASLIRSETATAEKSETGNRKMSKYTDAMAALAALAEDGDEDAKKAMKKMLSPAKAEESEGDKPEKKDEAKAEKCDDDPKAQAQAATRVAAEAVSEVASLRAELVKRDEALERTNLLAGRPDLTADSGLKAKLESMPLAVLREVVAIQPKAQTPGAAGTARPTQGATDGAGGLPPNESLDLKIRMGLETPDMKKVTHGPHFQAVFGGTPAQIETAFEISRTRGQSTEKV